MSVTQPDGAPVPATLESVFTVYEVQQNDDHVLYFGDPTTDRQTLLETVWPTFRDHGYEVHLARRTGEIVLVAEPHDTGHSGLPWKNIGLFIATIISTLYVGTSWYYIEDPFSLAALRAIPFTVAVLGVLGTHELGHYVMSRYHNVDASLPYFIPFPSLFGTMGAVIRMRGQMPDRDALFDIGVAGPLAGLVAAIIVTAIGLLLPPVHVPPELLSSSSAIKVKFAYPPLLQFIADVLNQPLTYSDPLLSVNPVVMGGWVGMFITFLNLIPVGQLDGGHILRSLIGEHATRIAPLVPASLFALGGYLWIIENVGTAASIWILWGFLTTIVAYMGSVHPINDDPLGWKRTVIGVLTFVLGALCFMPIPIQLV